MTTKRKHAAPPQPQPRTAAQVIERMNAEFASQRVSWNVFAQRMGLPQITLYKLSRGLTRKPWQRTLDEVWDALDRLGTRARKRA